MKAFYVKTLAPALLFSFTLGSSLAFAEDDITSMLNNEDALEQSVANVKSTMKFISSSDPVDPNHPEVIPPDKPGTDPENPENPDNPGGDGGGGDGTQSFHIAWASHLNFGDVALSRGTMKKYANPTTMHLQGDTQYAPFVQIVDMRTQSDGWNLSLKVSEFKDTDNHSRSLKGASLGFNNMVTIDSLASGVSKAPSVLNQTSVQTNNELVTLATANSSEGDGVWTISFTDNQKGLYEKDKGVMLTVPASALPKAGLTYEADVVWMLTASPFI